MDSNTANTIVDSFTQQIIDYLDVVYNTANNQITINEQFVKSQFNTTRTFTQNVIKKWEDIKK